MLRTGSILLASQVGLAFLLSGCAPEAKPGVARQTATPEQVAEMLEANVVGIHAYYDPYLPWLWNENKSKPRGIIIQALYLEGPRVKGVFGDGVIRPKMFVRYVNDSGEIDWRLVKEWEFDVQKAIPYRSKKETRQGWGYRLHLPWGELELAGREIRMIVEFQRGDGRVFSSGKKDFRVPQPQKAT